MATPDSLMLAIALVQYLALLIALVVHEYCHALVGYLLGDETARRMGRLTLNPAAHADLVGTVLLPLTAILSPGMPVFGWAKPVPFNPYNLKYPKWGPTLVALAGPLSNLLGAAVFLVVLKMVLAAGLPTANLLVLFLYSLVAINIVLAIFNVIPVPPLDGSKILSVVLDHPRHRNLRFFLETKGPMILMAIIFIDLVLPFSFLRAIFGTAIRGAFGLAGLAY